LVNGRMIETDLVFACDGIKSAIRSSLFAASAGEPEYTGVTCLMGASDVPRPAGYCYPTSSDSRFHACYYPTGEEEQIFQIFYVAPENKESWRALTADEGRLECCAVADRMKVDGWAEDFIQPLLEPKSVLRTGIHARPPIPVWHSGRVVLLGDAAHPLVSYIGQGAMMAVEDVGILVALLKAFCVTGGEGEGEGEGGAGGNFMLANVEKAFQLYERIRLPRTMRMARNSIELGNMLLLRATWPVTSEEALRDDQRLREDIAQHGNLSLIQEATAYDYARDVRRALRGSRGGGSKLASDAHV
ncbi:hypothetical protein HK405_015205, partial [Cladochytrium tenue]